MPDKSLSILAIGSCRIFRPLRYLHDQGAINLVNREHHQWFTHTAASALQFVDIAFGGMNIPENLRNAAFETAVG